jgi:hypothetical protein
MERDLDGLDIIFNKKEEREKDDKERWRELQSNFGVPNYSFLLSPSSFSGLPSSSRKALSNSPFLSSAYSSLYYHRESLCYSLDGRNVDMITVTNLLNNDLPVFSDSYSTHALSSYSSFCTEKDKTQLELMKEEINNEEIYPYAEGTSLSNLNKSLYEKHSVLPNSTSTSLSLQLSTIFNYSSNYLPLSLSYLLPPFVSSFSNSSSTSITSSSSKNPFTYSLSPLSPFPSNCSSCYLTPSLSFPKKLVFFVSARVHPGETPSSFVLLGFFFLNFLCFSFISLGFLRFIFRIHNPQTQFFLHNFVVKIVPIINVDGVSWGFSRSDIIGNNLNRFFFFFK